jgi:endonuclease/exonuclease/phosphatase family metal-dependent hydrolase
MNKCCLLILIISFHHEISAQNIPQIGNDYRIEFANWNLEWFGKTEKGFGPDNDSLQQANISKILNLTDIDLWALEEIADSNALKNILTKMPQYQSIISSFHPEQKTALLYKKNDFTYLSHQLLGTENKDSFSTGRYPLEVKLYSKKLMDTVYIVVVHLKSNYGNDSLKQIAYNSRKRSSEWFNQYIKQNHKDHYFVILGDWNDDVDRSIYNQLPSPFTNLIYNSLGHKFSTQALSLSGKSSTVSYPDFIDHQFFSKRLVDQWISDSCFVLQADQWITDYGKTVSDHFPVVTFLKPHMVSTANPSFEKIQIYPNPCKKYLKFEIPMNCLVEIYNSNGLKVLSKNVEKGENLNLESLTMGIYFVHLHLENSIKMLKLELEF